MSIKPSCQDLAAVCCGVLHRSFSSVWLKRTWERWEDWTEGGKPAHLTSKSTPYHCRNDGLKLVSQSQLFFSVSVRIQSHPYYPFVWGSQESREKGQKAASTHTININQISYMQSTYSITHYDPSVTCLPNNDEILKWRLRKLGTAAGQLIFNVSISRSPSKTDLSKITK